MPANGPWRGKELPPCPKCGCDLSYPDIVDEQSCRKCRHCGKQLVGSHGPSQSLEAIQFFEQQEVAAR